jgi:CspA family cold shock protein
MSWGVPPTRAGFACFFLIREQQALDAALFRNLRFQRNFGCGIAVTIPKFVREELRCIALGCRKKLMANGKVKWFDNKKGFGFIEGEDGKDVFVHHSVIEAKGFRTLAEGEVVNYELIQSEKGMKAKSVQRIQA